MQNLKCGAGFVGSLQTSQCGMHASYSKSANLLVEQSRAPVEIFDFIAIAVNNNVLHADHGYQEPGNA